MSALYSKHAQNYFSGLKWDKQYCNLILSWFDTGGHYDSHILDFQPSVFNVKNQQTSVVSVFISSYEYY